MSYESWVIEGRGICLNDIDTSVERVEKLLELEPELQKEVHAKIRIGTGDEKAPVSLEDYRHYEWEEAGFASGLGAILIAIVHKREGFELSAADDFNGKTYVIYEKSYPWLMTGRGEKLLTKEGIDVTFKRYAGILTDKEIEVEYQRAENGG